jgi:hypothetical protein
MKKRIFSVILMMMVSLTLTTALYAKHDETGSGKGMRGKHMMMKMMMQKSVVATSDGGVVVVAGNKITKYDKNLKVVNEADIKMDMEAMGQQMHEMMANCPMMNKEGKSDEASSTAATSDADHEKHH